MKVLSSELQHILRMLRKGVYLLVIAGLLTYLYLLGSEPWHYLFENWHVFLTVAGISGVAIFVQAASFREVQPLGSNRLSWVELTRIWSFSGVVSVIAPVFSGLATRTALLVEAGMALSVCVVASVRQIWVGLEYALLSGGVVGFFIVYPGVELLAVIFVVAGVGMTLLRVYGVGLQTKPRLNRSRWVEELRVPVVGRAHPWYVAQVGAMAAIYYVAFNGLGATMGWHEATMLSTVTILASLIVVIPNGYGVPVPTSNIPEKREIFPPQSLLQLDSRTIWTERINPIVRQSEIKLAELRKLQKNTENHLYFDWDEAIFTKTLSPLKCKF